MNNSLLYNFSRGGNLNSAIPNGIFNTTNVRPIRPLNTALWGGINRGGGLTSAIGNMGKTSAGVLGKIGTGLKYMSGPIGAALGAAGFILGAKDAGAGEDEMMQNINHPQTPMLASHTPGEYTPYVPNSITPLVAPPVAANGPIMSPSLPPQPSSLPLQGGASLQGGTNLSDILKTIQSIQPVQSFEHRLGALNTGNTTWDMNGLQKIMAAKSGQQADEARYASEVGALGTLGSSQMQSEAARYGHEVARYGHENQLLGDREKNAYLAPYYAGLGNKAIADASVAPLHAKADVLKALTEQSKDNPILKGMLETLKGYSDRTDAQGYNDYAAKIAMLTGKIIPKMMLQD